MVAQQSIKLQNGSFIQLSEIKFCECGCGKPVNYNTRSKNWNRYIKGHNNIYDIGFNKGHKPWNTGIKGGTVGSFKKGLIPWNKGLNKDIDNRVKKNGINTSKTKKKKFENGELIHPRGMLGKENKWGHHTESSKLKMSISSIGKNTGENNPLWKGGISFEPYCPKFNNSFKESIRKKFSYKCFICGITQDEQMNKMRSEGKRSYKLSTHHVNYDKNCLCDDIKCEFVPLCLSCHTKTTNNRDYWESKINLKLRGLA